MSGIQKQQAYYRQDVEEVLEKLQTSRSGLKDGVVKIRLDQYGPNKLTDVHKDTWLVRYARQYKDPMIILLLFSSLVVFLIGDVRTAVVLFALASFNTLISFSQEFKAEKLMESLSKLVVAQAKVVRNGSLQLIESTELVPGDIVSIEAGDLIPTDLRVISEDELSTNDFALTGESNPSRKFTHAIESDVELANRHNLVFMGTTVATGQALGVVIATGMQTELGRIASLSADTPAEFSPLQREMNNIAKRVTQWVIILCAALLPVAIYSGLPFKNALLFAIGFASSLIPNGLPAAINTSLAQAASKLAKAHALVKKLSAVETLGATSIICTDKTGTLTKNEMTVQEIMIGNNLYQLSGTGYENNGSVLESGIKVPQSKLNQMDLFFTTGAFASNAKVAAPDSEHSGWYCVGDPTEGALITLAGKAGFDTDQLESGSPELKEFSFDSARKRMSSIRKYGPHGQLYVFVKGAPESVMEGCDEIWDHGHIRSLKVADQAKIMSQHTDWANQARRNLAFAYKVLPAKTDISKLKMKDVEKGLTLLGLVSMLDPLRDEVPAAMMAAHRAHIKVNIVTGDFAPTAKAIATSAKLAETGQTLEVVSGEELRKLSDSQVTALVTRGGTIFSRVSPEDKLRIVDLAKLSGHVVAVTGDGINDAPALKRADIGVAMGITGTDIAKQSAEIVLLDDSFHTLVSATNQGRLIFHNIKKSTLAAFTSNSAELVVNLLSLTAAVIFKIPLALTVMLILAIDLIAELFPIAALGWDKAEGELMTEQPRNPHTHILNIRSVTDILWCGLLIGGFAFANYIMLMVRGGISPSQAILGSPIQERAMAITYLTMVLCLFINTLQLRSSKGLFTKYQMHNKQLGIAFIASLFCVCVIIYSPIVSPYFGTGALSVFDWMCAIGAAVIFMIIREVQRHANTHHTRDHIIKLYEQTSHNNAQV